LEVATTFYGKFLDSNAKTNKITFSMNSSYNKVKLKVKLAHEQATMVQRGSRGKSLLFL